MSPFSKEFLTAHMNKPLKPIHIGLSNKMYGHHSQSSLNWLDQAVVTWS